MASSLAVVGPHTEVTWPPRTGSGCWAAALLSEPDGFAGGWSSRCLHMTEPFICFLAVSRSQSQSFRWSGSEGRSPFFMQAFAWGTEETGCVNMGQSYLGLVRAWGKYTWLRQGSCLILYVCTRVLCTCPGHVHVWTLGSQAASGC